MASTRSYRPGEGSNTDGGNENRRNELRRRATSDPKPPASITKSPIENALDRAYEKKLARMASITQKDVDRMKARSTEAEDELRGRLDDLGQIAMDITRRLDYTYYSLLERIGSLVSTIHSFQSLSTQSQALLNGFEMEAELLDKDIKRRIGKFKEGFYEREVRVAGLEQRGKIAGNKAMQLGQRLESARIIVEDWEKRESEAMKARARMWKGAWCALVGLMGVIIALLIWREWSLGMEPVRPDLGLQEKESSNNSLMVDGELLRKKQIPEDVKSILHGIESRRSSQPSRGSSRTPHTSVIADDDDQRLRALEEL